MVARTCNAHGEHDEWSERGECRHCRREKDRLRRNGRTERKLAVPGHYCNKHGEHDDWGLRKPHGKHVNPELRCRPCDRERYHAKKDSTWRKGARERAQAKVRAKGLPAREAYRERQRLALLEVYGHEVADAYAQAIRLADGSVSVVALLRGIVTAAHPEWSRKQVVRSIALNRIEGKALTNKGWQCAHCFVASPEPSFFDLDHIIPRAELRKLNGSARPPQRRTSAFPCEKDNNLQILCPSCHRCKTLNLAPWFEVESAA